MRNLRLDICYDGTRYRGWQRLPNSDQTIQGKIESVLSRVLGEPIEISGSGRTDAGVHAVRQVANFRCHSTMSCEEILLNLRKYLPEDIGIYSCRDVSERFHARLNARWKTYRYRLWIGGDPCVFERKFVSVLRGDLNIEEMRKAAKLLEGTHDFAAFCANKHMKKSTVRTLASLKIEEHGSELVFFLKGNGFLHNMVRIIVGTLIEVGQGSRTANSVTDLFGAARAEAGFTAEASGLCLMEVEY